MQVIDEMLGLSFQVLKFYQLWYASTSRTYLDHWTHRSLHTLLSFDSSRRGLNYVGDSMFITLLRVLLLLQVVHVDVWSLL